MQPVDSSTGTETAPTTTPAIVVKPMSPMRPSQDDTPINAFRQDPYHMGQDLGTNVTIMYANHADSPCSYLIVIDRMTGERVQIEFPISFGALTASADKPA